MNYSMNIDMERLSRHRGRIRLAAFDVDGTLLNSSRKITPRTLEAIRGLRDSGIYTVLVTGRSYLGVKPLYDQIEALGPIVCFNGARVVSGHDGSDISSIVMDGKITRRAIELCRERDIHIQVFQGDEFYYEAVREEGLDYEMHTNLQGITASFDQFSDLSALKALCIAEHEKLEELAVQMRSSCGDSLYQVFSFPHYLEMMDARVSKSRGLSIVCSTLGITMDEAAAFGDGENDIDMLASAGVGVAMENAPESVKEAAGHVTCSNDQEGLAVFIEQHHWLFMQDSKN